MQKLLKQQGLQSCFSARRNIVFSKRIYYLCLTRYDVRLQTSVYKWPQNLEKHCQYAMSFFPILYLNLVWYREKLRVCWQCFLRFWGHLKPGICNLTNLSLVQNTHSNQPSSWLRPRGAGWDYRAVTTCSAEERLIIAEPTKTLLDSPGLILLTLIHAELRPLCPDWSLSAAVYQLASTSLRPQGQKNPCTDPNNFYAGFFLEELNFHWV